MNKTQKIVLAASLVLALGAGGTAVALAVNSDTVATPVAKESPSPTASESEETKPSPSQSETAEKDKDKEKVKGDAPEKPGDTPKAEDPAKPADPAKPEAPKAETEQPKPAKPAEPAPAPAPPAPAPPAPAPAPPAPAPAPPVTSSTAEESDVLARVNAKRAASGLGALTINGKLTQAAVLQAEYQATNKTMTHDGNGGLGARVSSKGYNWCALAENVAMGYGNTEAVFNGWVNSPGHLANILSPNVTEMGLALAKDSNGTPYWAQVFGKSC